MQWLKLPAWKVGDRGLETYSSIHVSKKQKFLTSSLIKIQYCDREVASPAQTARARISNAVSEWQCHHIHLTILRGFSWSSIAYNCAQRWPETPFISFHFSQLTRCTLLHSVAHIVIYSLPKPSSIISGEFQKNTIRCVNVDFILGHRQRRWPNIKPLSAQRLLSAGVPHTGRSGDVS